MVIEGALAGTDGWRTAGSGGDEQRADDEGGNHAKILAVCSGVAMYEDRPIRAGGLYLSLGMPFRRRGYPSSPRLRATVKASLRPLQPSFLMRFFMCT